MHFLLQKNLKKYHAWSCQNVCDALTFLLDIIFIRFGTKLYRQVVGIPMGTYCTPLVADLFLFCYERDFMMSRVGVIKIVILIDCNLITFSKVIAFNCN